MLTEKLEKYRKHHGTFLARSYFSGWGTLLLVWVAVLHILESLQLIGYMINVPLLLGGMLLATFAFSGLLFVLGATYWSAPYRHKEGEPHDAERELDHWMRALGDQWLTTAVALSSGAILLWLIVFYFTYSGPQAYAPLPPTYDPVATMHFAVIKVFQGGAASLVPLAAMIVALYTGSDAFKRHAMERYVEYKQSMDSGASAATNTMTGMPAPKPQGPGKSEMLSWALGRV